MANAHVNAEELRRFARSLKQFDSDLTNRMSHMRGQFAQLGDTWRDQQHVRFAQEFQQTMTTLERFIREAETQIPSLLKRADIIDQYNQIR